MAKFVRLPMYYVEKGAVGYFNIEDIAAIYPSYPDITRTELRLKSTRDGEEIFISAPVQEVMQLVSEASAQ